PSTQPVTVNFSAADGSATAGSDYIATSGTLTFNPGTTTQSITVTVKGDNTLEQNETFSVNLSSPVNASLADGTGIGTIVNDDGFPKISVHNENVREGDAGTTPATFAVRLSKPRPFPVTVDFATEDATASAGLDYVAASGSITFDPGEVVKNIVVQVMGDVIHESNESFTVVLSNAVNGIIGDRKGIGVICDDDPRPKISMSGTTVNEGNGGTTPAVFDVRLSNPSSEVVIVRFATDNASASAPSDYVATSGTLIFDQGEATKSITVDVNGDLLPERDEEFRVRLSKAENARIEENTAKCKIIDDDVPSIASRYDDLISAIQSLPSEAFKKPSERRREQLINSVNHSKSLFERGKLKAAQDVLQHNVLNRLRDSGPDAWIVQQAARDDLAQKTSDIVGLLEMQVASASIRVEETMTMELADIADSPLEFALLQNYPNPFNPSTTIRYQLARETHVSLKVYSMLGELVATLVERDEGPGNHQVQWSPTLASGTYVYRLEAGDFVAVRKLVIIK
ncbi:MAG: Calx-beta domain-containing protein, partial [Bacteroidota bacterium]